MSSERDMNIYVDYPGYFISQTLFCIVQMIDSYLVSSLTVIQSSILSLGPFCSKDNHNILLRG